MNEAAKNIYLLFSVWTYTIISLGIAFRVNRGRFMLTLLIFQSGCPILYSCQQCMTVIPSSSTLRTVNFFNFSFSGVSVVVFHDSFNMHFSDDS